MDEKYARWYFSRFRMFNESIMRNEREACLCIDGNYEYEEPIIHGKLTNAILARSLMNDKKELFNVPVDELYDAIIAKLINDYGEDDIEINIKELGSKEYQEKTQLLGDVTFYDKKFHFGVIVKSTGEEFELPEVTVKGTSKKDLSGIDVLKGGKGNKINILNTGMLANIDSQYASYQWQDLLLDVAENNLIRTIAGYENERDERIFKIYKLYDEMLNKMME